MGSAGSAQPLESVDRALRLVQMLNNGERLSVSEAAPRLGVAPSTAHRLLSTLVHRGFAVQDGERRYVLGPALVRRDVPTHTVPELRTLARPALEQMHRDLDETVQLMVRDGEFIVFVDGIENQSRTLRVVMRLGDRMPAYCSAGGKALLAELTNRDIERIYPKGLTPWPMSRFASVRTLTRHLTGVRRLGYGTSREETEQGVIGLGVAVHDGAGLAVAALTIAIPSVRHRREDDLRYVQVLRDAAAMCERSLTAPR